MAKHTYTFSEHGGDTQMRKADSHDPFRFDKSAHKNIVADSRCPRSGSDTQAWRRAQLGRAFFEGTSRWLLPP